MRIQIDTTNKTVRIEEQVKLPELFSLLKKMLPNDEWKAYSLEQAAITYWANPITWPYAQPFYNDPNVFKINCTSDTQTHVQSMAENNLLNYLIN